MTEAVVVDTSALISALVTDRAPPGLRERLARSGRLEAPHLVDLEFIQALRRLVRRGEISLDRAADARTIFGELPLTRYPHEPLGDRIWELRDNLSAYDGSFVALAEVLGAPLVTCDRALLVAAGPQVRIEHFQP